MVGNGVKIIVAVGAIAVQQDFSALLKAPSPLEVTGFDGFFCRVGVETLM